MDAPEKPLRRSRTQSTGKQGFRLKTWVTPHGVFDKRPSIGIRNTEGGDLL